MSFELTVEMGGLVIFDPTGERLMALDHGSHALYLFFRPYHLVEKDSKLPTGHVLGSDKQGNRFLKLEKSWRVEFPASEAMPSEHGDHRDWKYALAISELGLTGLKKGPDLCGGLKLPKTDSEKGALGELPATYESKVTGRTLRCIGDKLYWRARYTAECVDLAILRDGRPVGRLRVATKGDHVTIDAACVGGSSIEPFDEHKGLEKAATGTFVAPKKVRGPAATGARHVGSGSCPPTKP